MTTSSSLNPQPGFHARPASLDDVPRIMAMLDATTQHWVGRPTSEEEVRDRLATPHTTLEQHTVVVLEEDDRAVGFGHLWPAQPDEIRCFARTHPDHRGRGVGTAIQQVLIAAAAKLAGAAAPTSVASATAMVLTTTTWPRDAESDALVSTLGYRPVRYFQKMVMDFAHQQPRPVTSPPGLTIRGYLPSDEDAIFAAFVEAFADHWGEEHVDRETWWLDRRDAEAAGYEPELWLVAMDGDELAGFVTAKTQLDAAGTRHGYVGDLGVRPGWRGIGLGELLLTRSITMLRDRGLPFVTLDVDTENTSGAVRLYTKVGMKPRPSFTIWSLELQPG